MTHKKRLEIQKQEVVVVFVRTLQSQPPDKMEARPWGEPRADIIALSCDPAMVALGDVAPSLPPAAGACGTPDMALQEPALVEKQTITAQPRGHHLVELSPERSTEEALGPSPPHQDSLRFISTAHERVAVNGSVFIGASSPTSTQPSEQGSPGSYAHVEEMPSLSPLFHCATGEPDTHNCAASLVLGAAVSIGHAAGVMWGYPTVACSPLAIARAISVRLAGAAIAAERVVFTGTALLPDRAAGEDLLDALEAPVEGPCVVRECGCSHIRRRENEVCSNACLPNSHVCRGLHCFFSPVSFRL